MLSQKRPHNWELFLTCQFPHKLYLAPCSENELDWITLKSVCFLHNTNSPEHQCRLIYFILRGVQGTKARNFYGIIISLSCTKNSKKWRPYKHTNKSVHLDIPLQATTKTLKGGNKNATAAYLCIRVDIYFKVWNNNGPTRLEPIQLLKPSPKCFDDNAHSKISTLDY